VWLLCVAARFEVVFFNLAFACRVLRFVVIIFNVASGIGMFEVILFNVVFCCQERSVNFVDECVFLRDVCDIVLLLAGFLLFFTVGD
jgi:hypothetical protein